MADVKIGAREERLGCYIQATYNESLADSTTFYTMQWVNAGNLILDNATTLDQFNVISQHGVHNEIERAVIDTVGGFKSIPITGIAEKSVMAPLLYSSHFVCTEAAGTPFNKVITAGGLTAPLDFANNGTKFFTWAIDQGGTATQGSPASTSDDGIQLLNGVVDNLNIVWDMGADGTARFANYSATILGNQTKHEQSLSGTWTNATPAQNFFNNSDTWAFIALTVDSVDLKQERIRRVEYNVNNNFASSTAAIAGKINQYDFAPEYTMKVILNYNAVTEKCLNDFNLKATVDANWSNDSGQAKTDGKWTIDMPTSYLYAPTKIYEGDFLGIELNIKAFSTAGATPVTINYCDTIDWTF